MSAYLRQSAKPYYDTIARAIRSRGAKPEDLQVVPEVGECRYSLRMCENLVGIIDRKDVGLEDVIYAKRKAEAHPDLPRTLAIYCEGLATAGPDILDRVD